MPIFFGKHVQKPQIIRGRHMFSLEQMVENKCGDHADHLPAFIIPFWANKPSHQRSDEIRLVVFSSIRRLPTPERRVIIFRHIEGRTWREVAIRCALSRQWCKKLEHKALMRLRTMKPLVELTDQLQEIEMIDEPIVSTATSFIPMND